MSEILLDKEQIMQIIPHRDPFLLIDEVIEMEAGKKITAHTLSCLATKSQPYSNH